MFIILILYLHEGRPLPEWPLSITINSLVSVFSAIMSAAMLLTNAEIMSQGKWHWFTGERHPLKDMDVFDQASRGPWGAFKMLWSIRWSKIYAF